MQIKLCCLKEVLTTHVYNKDEDGIIYHHHADCVIIYCNLILFQLCLIIIYTGRIVRCDAMLDGVWLHYAHFAMQWYIDGAKLSYKRCLCVYVFLYMRQVILNHNIIAI